MDKCPRCNAYLDTLCDDFENTTKICNECGYTEETFRKLGNNKIKEATMTQDQVIKKAEVIEKHVCEICGELIEPEDIATYSFPNGPDDFEPLPVHSWCLDEREEQMYRQGEDLL